TNSDMFFGSWLSVASSADGSKLVAVGNRVYYSIDSGSTWAETGTSLIPGSLLWPAHVVACSADGETWAVAISGTAGSTSGVPAPIFTSTNRGATWTSTASPSNMWLFVSASADAKRLIAGGFKADFTTPAGVYT